MGATLFAVHRDLADFAFAQTTVDELLVRKLHNGQLTQEAHNEGFIGGPVTGKKQLATASGVEAC